MTKKKAIFLTVFLVFAAAGYIYMYGGAFRKPAIEIFHTRPRTAAMRRPNANAQNTPPPVGITFGMLTEYRLTSVKVVRLAEYKTNKYIHPIWELVSDSNSPPIKAFTYGENIRGMHTAIKGDRAEPLSNDVPYRLFIEAGKVKGQHDFTLSSSPTDSPTNAAAR